MMAVDDERMAMAFGYANGTGEMWMAFFKRFVHVFELVGILGGPEPNSCCMPSQIPPAMLARRNRRAMPRTMSIAITAQVTASPTLKTKPRHCSIVKVSSFNDLEAVRAVNVLGRHATLPTQSIAATP
jgi:hypothetical protein